MRFYIIIIVISGYAVSTKATVWNVGPGRAYNYCSEVSNLVKDGDTIKINNAVYKNDRQVQWTKSNLHIIGINGRPRLEAGSMIATDLSNGKGIFVTQGKNITIENIEFSNAKVVDHNGAGIRQEGADLTIVHCKFTNNEMGILTGNIPNCTTRIESSEFSDNGSADNPGYQHNVYINHIDTLIIRYNYSRDAIAEGHELKSRANVNIILYNHISNENTVDSRTIDLPNGGTTIIMGNIIEQGIHSANNNLLGYGLEGLSNTSSNSLYIVNNTFINKKNIGNFVQIQDGIDTLYMKNNILAGIGSYPYSYGHSKYLDTTNNLSSIDVADFKFKNSARREYFLNQNSIAINRGVFISKKVLAYELISTRIYYDTCFVKPRTSDDRVDVGAYEYDSTTPIDLSVPARFNIFPNPTADILHFSQPIQYSLFDLMGNLIFTGNGDQISLHNLVPGTYLLQNQSHVYKIRRF